MVVITLTSCPPALRGDLSLWMQEISTGVYVGRLSARVRDRLWERIKENLGSGRATMVYSVNNEQHMDFRVYNSEWEPIDFDGLKLMLKPSSARLRSKANHKSVVSTAGMIRRSKRFQSFNRRNDWILSEYAVLDIETTGLTVGRDSIIEIGVLKVIGDEVIATYNALIEQEGVLPKNIADITGITDDLLARDGINEKKAISQALDIIGDMPIVCHNAPFDMGFIRYACRRCSLYQPDNFCVDTMVIAKNAIEHIENYKLSTLAKFLGVESTATHRSMPDCFTTKQVYDKLKKIAVDRTGK